MKLDDLIDQYEQGAKLRGLAPTQMNALKVVRRGLGRAHVPDRLTPERIGQYVADRRAGGWSNAHGHRPAKDGTIRRELGALSAVLNWGVQKRLIEDAPSIDLPPASPPRERFLTDEGADILWHYAEKAALDMDSPHHAVGLFTCLALDTWARAAAIEGLTWGRVDFDRRQIDYRDPTRVETAKRRVPVPISSRLLPVLKAARRWGDTRPVVGPITQYAWKQFRDSINCRALDGLTRHDLRRTGISKAVARGVDLLKVAQMAGDDYDTVLKHYARFAPNYLEGVVT